jgi:hypothetical protein
LTRVRLLLAAAAAAIAALIPLTAFADSCVNVSRAPASCGSNCLDGPVIKGNWVWLPSVDPQSPAAWGFATPGGPDSVQFGFPGSNGNYTNGYSISLLGHSIHCAPSGDPSARQGSHGIQTGCV